MHAQMYIVMFYPSIKLCDTFATLVHPALMLYKHSFITESYYNYFHVSYMPFLAPQLCAKVDAHINNNYRISGIYGEHCI